MATKGFFQAQDLDPVSQTKISIPADNGLDFTPTQKITFHIPPTTKFFQPSECYLEASVSLTLPEMDSNGVNATRVQLDSALGAQSLIRDIRVLTNGGVLLEELQNVNVLMGVKYDYETNDNFRNKRALTEGATNWIPDTRGTVGQTKSNMANCVHNPYSKRAPFQTGIDRGGIDAKNCSFVNADMQLCKVCLPLPTGIFMGERVFPNMLVDGLRIEVLLEEPRFVFRQLDNVNRHRYLSLNPTFSTNNGSTAPTDGSAATGLAMETGFNHFYIDRSNGNWDVNNFPFVVGERFQFLSAATADAADATSGVIGGSTNLSGSDLVIVEIDFDARNEIDFGRGGIKISCKDAGDTATQAQVSAAIPANVKNTAADRTVMFSTQCDLSDWNPTYTLKNVALIVGEVEMPPQYEQGLLQGLSAGGTMNYMYPSYTNYKFSQLASERVANIRLPLQNSQARAILHIPTDATTAGQGALTNAKGNYVVANGDGTGLQTDYIVRQQGAGFRGCWDNLSNYQMIYDNRLQPSRKVECALTAAKFSISQQPMIELEKALLMSGFDPHSFRAFQENAVIGRALALNDGVYDARGKDYSLQVEYNETETPTINKLWHNWCAHLRTLMISGDAIRVQI